MEALVTLLLTSLDLLDRLRSKPFNRRQTDALQTATDRIEKELRHIEVQCEKAPQKFSGHAHKKAVLEDSWQLLIRDIEPLKHIPTYRRTSQKLVSLLRVKNAPASLPRLQHLRDSINAALIFKGH